jgi:hypothetical protein
MVMRWGSPLVQETYREERACDKRHDDDDDDDDDNNNNNNNNNDRNILILVPARKIRT